MKTLTIKNFRSEHEVLIAPMTAKEIIDNVRSDGTIQAKVLVSLTDLIKWDIDTLNDFVSEKITGSEIGLLDITYKISGRTTNNEMILKVTGEVYLNS